MSEALEEQEQKQKQEEVSPEQVDVEEKAPATAAQIEEAVNERLATCAPVKIGKDEFNITVSLKQKETEVKGGKRNRRKTRSKRSARKSHKSRRVFGGKRK